MWANYWAAMARRRRPRGRLRNHFREWREHLVIFGLMILGLMIPTSTGEPSKEYQMNDVCKNHFLRDLYRKIDGAVLTSQNERNLDCAITFQTHSILQRFMLRFDRLQLDCNDHLYIYDGAHAVGNFKVDLSCRSTELSVSALYTRTNFVTLKYVTDAWGTDTNGFRLVISAIKDPKHACKDFRCTTKEFCIDTDLVCDGIRHCEDGSDETASTLCANPEASTILGMESTLFAVAMIFVVLSMVGIVAAGVLCFCRQRAATPGHIHNAHNAQTHPPVIFPFEEEEAGIDEEKAEKARDEISHCEEDEEEEDLSQKQDLGEEKHLEIEKSKKTCLEIEKEVEFLKKEHQVKNHQCQEQDKCQVTITLYYNNKRVEKCSKDCDKVFRQKEGYCEEHYKNQINESLEKSPEYERFDKCKYKTTVKIQYVGQINKVEKEEPGRNLEEQCQKCQRVCQNIEKVCAECLQVFKRNNHQTFGGTDGFFEKSNHQQSTCLTQIQQQRTREEENVITEAPVEENLTRIQDSELNHNLDYNTKPKKLHRNKRIKSKILIAADKPIKMSWNEQPCSKKFMLVTLSFFLIITTFLHDVLCQIPDLENLIEKRNQSGRDFFIGPCLVKTNNSCPDPEIQFFVYTKSNRETAQQIFVNDSGSNLAETFFRASDPTKIIVHGYNSDMQLSSLVDIRNEYLKRDESYNLIAVDWQRLANGPCYPVAVHNVPHVGSCLAQLINRLRETGAGSIHVIGFSLGAHVPAFSANNLKPYKLDRITGLDPAMPLFITVGDDQKLDKSDAEFVDIFHTNAFIQGKVEATGHIDFYMNGGINQPGCWEKRNPFGCNHHRAAEYFAESVNSQVGFWGWPCSGFLAYLLGLCPPRFPAVLAGDKVNRNYRGFHLVKTKGASPFAERDFETSTKKKKKLKRQRVTLLPWVI